MAEHRCPQCESDGPHAVTTKGWLLGNYDTTNTATCGSCGHREKVAAFAIHALHARVEKAHAAERIERHERQNLAKDYDRLRARVAELNAELLGAYEMHDTEQRLHREVTERSDRLRDAGRALATCAFNLKQCDHLTEPERRSLSESQETWDAAVDTR